MTGRSDPDRPARVPRRVTPDTLRALAVAHLERYPCSSAHLRRVLHRKIRRSARHHGDDEAALITAAEAVITALQGGPLLDDARYAGAVAESLHRRGVSRRATAQRLRHKGVAPDEIEAAVAAVADDLAAATRYARRRRLGPFDPDPVRRAERRSKHLAALARQGFDYDTARRVIDADDPDTLTDER